MNISQKLSQKLIMLLSHWITSCKQTETDKAYKPDINFKDRRAKTCKMIDLEMLALKNVSIAEFEKLSIYKDLEIKEEKL